LYRKEGWLKKQGFKRKNWKRYICKPAMLCYDVAAAEEIGLSGVAGGSSVCG
jgi:hypothetical protein